MYSLAFYHGNYRITEDASVYYITYSVVEWLPVFVSEEACMVIANSLRHCHVQKPLRINAYVIMPTHIHLIVFDADHDTERLSATLAAFRQFTGRAMLDYCLEHMPRVFTECFKEAAIGDRSRRFWQLTGHPVAIHSEKFWRQKIDYLHDNPRRKGLVLYAEDWRFSSARYFRDGDAAHSDVLITQLDWYS